MVLSQGFLLALCSDRSWWVSGEKYVFVDHTSFLNEGIILERASGSGTMCLACGFDPGPTTYCCLATVQHFWTSALSHHQSWRCSEEYVVLGIEAVIEL